MRTQTASPPNAGTHVAERMHTFAQPSRLSQFFFASPNEIDSIASAYADALANRTLRILVLFRFRAGNKNEIFSMRVRHVFRDEKDYIRRIVVSSDSSAKRVRRFLAIRLRLFEFNKIERLHILTRRSSSLAILKWFSMASKSMTGRAVSIL